VASSQAAVTSAQIGVGKAEDNLAAATLTAPMAGTVASVGLVAGSAAGSNSIVILAPGAAEITVDVPLANMPKVKKGMDAEVVADGATAPLAGSVTSIGLLPAATATSSGRSGSGTASTATTSTVAYPVVVLVPEAGGAFVTGSQASVSLDEGTTEDVITVPSSAVTRTATGTASVTVLTGGQPTRRTVKTGLSGPTATEITAGLKAGEQVVLADLTATLPANSSTSRNRFGGAGGVTGRQGGFTGGGFTGGPPAGGARPPG
jgi:HlyD family secretion protein